MHILEQYIWVYIIYIPCHSTLEMFNVPMVVWHMVFHKSVTLNINCGYMNCVVDGYYIHVPGTLYENQVLRNYAPADIHSLLILLVSARMCTQ